MNHQDKGLVHFQHKPMVEYSVELLGERLSLISANRNQQRYQHYAPVVSDQLEGYLGPLAGMHAVLCAAQSQWVGFVACDMPLLTKQAIEALETAATNADAPLQAVFAFDGNYPHPTVCMVRRDVVEAIEQFLNSGERKLGYFLRTLPHQRLLIDNPRQFSNMNAESDITSLM